MLLKNRAFNTEQDAVTKDWRVSVDKDLKEIQVDLPNERKSGALKKTIDEMVEKVRAKENAGKKNKKTGFAGYFTVD